MATKEPTTFLEAVAYFSDPDRAHEYITRIRWPYGVACPRDGCGSADVRFVKTRRVWFCKDCGRQFTVKVNTIFEDSPIGFDKWLPAMWLLGGCRNGISSCELARQLGVTQKTAWFMLHRIRLAMRSRTFEKLRGPVQVDEAFVTGKWRRARRGKKVLDGRKHALKDAVMAIIQPGEEARAFPIPDVTADSLVPRIELHVQPGATIYTDEAKSYRVLRRRYKHESVNHRAEEYVRGPVTTNAVENFWSLLKRAIRGTYIGVDVRHLGRYCDEQAFRYNMVGEPDSLRLARAAKGADGKRLTYADLTKKPPRKYGRKKYLG